MGTMYWDICPIIPQDAIRRKHYSHLFDKKYLPEGVAVAIFIVYTVFILLPNERVVRILTEANVNIEYTYAFVAHSKDNAYVIVRVDSNEKAISVLTKNEVTLLNEKELYNM